MYFRRDMLSAGPDLYVVKRRFPIEQWQIVIEGFGAKEICQAYNCEKILRGGDGFFYLVDLVEDAVILHI